MAWVEVTVVNVARILQRESTAAGAPTRYSSRKVCGTAKRRRWPVMKNYQRLFKRRVPSYDGLILDFCDALFFIMMLVVSCWYLCICICRVRATDGEHQQLHPWVQSARRAGVLSVRDSGPVRREGCWPRRQVSGE